MRYPRRVTMLSPKEVHMRSLHSGMTTQKLAQSLTVLANCFGEKGVWADPVRYRNQCWTRDFGMAILPALLILEEYEIIKKHLRNLVKFQRDDGKIPILFLDNEQEFVKEKERISAGKDKKSFMLGRYLEGQIHDLTPGTKDSEIHFIYAVCLYVETTGDANFWNEMKHTVRKAYRYIEKNLIQDDLVVGCDWRDTMEKVLGDKKLLTNNCLLYRSLSRLQSVQKNHGWIIPKNEITERLALLEYAIMRTFFVNGEWIDYPGSDRFDPLGGAFLILCGVLVHCADELSMKKKVLEQFRSVDTEYGVTIKCRHNPTEPKEKEVIEKTDGVVVWPFVVGFTAIAAHMINDVLDAVEGDSSAKIFAEEQRKKLLALNGLAEWYDPEDGVGYGAKEQLWSATLTFITTICALDK